jgi:hypothetical protein
MPPEDHPAHRRGNSNVKVVATATATGSGGDGRIRREPLPTINARRTATGNASSYKIDLCGAVPAGTGGAGAGHRGGDADTIRNELDQCRFDGDAHGDEQNLRDHRRRIAVRDRRRPQPRHDGVDGRTGS